MQIVQVIKNVENIDDEYIEKLQELVLFYWEYKDNNPDIVLAEAQLGVCNLNLNGNSQRTRLRRMKQDGGKRVVEKYLHFKLLGEKMKKIIIKIYVKLNYLWWAIKHPIKYFKWKQLPK